MHEASSECVWLRLTDDFIKGFCGFLDVPATPTISYKDTAMCIAHIKAGYIKGNEINHILPKLFFIHEL